MATLNRKTRIGGLNGVAWFASVLALLAMIAAAPRARADEPGWVLTQTSVTMGDQYVYISPKGVKCVNPRVGVALVSRAPDWHVIMYNDQTKCYFETSVAQWKSTLDDRGMHGLFDGAKWKKAGKTTIAGLKATDFEMISPPVAQKLPDGHIHHPDVKTAHFYVSDEIQAPVKLSDLLATAYGVPTTDNVALKVVYSTSKSTTKVALNTYRMQQSAIPDSYFQTPDGYKLAHSDAEVFMNRDQRDAVDEMARQLGSDGGGISSAPSASASFDNLAGTKLPNGYTLSKNDMSKVKDFLNKLQK